MSKPIRKTSVFSHEQDEAFQLTMALDLLLHKATPVRGTGIERAALKERVARIAHCIGQADLFANVADRHEPYERAIELSRVSFITLALRELGESLTDAQYQEARTLVQKLRVILRKRCDAANGLQPGAQPPADRDLLH